MIVLVYRQHVNLCYHTQSPNIENQPFNVIDFVLSLPKYNFHYPVITIYKRLYTSSPDTASPPSVTCQFFAGACKIRHIQDIRAPGTTEYVNKATDFPETWVGVTATGSQKIVGLKSRIKIRCF
jgi:hypothetical protein